MRSDAPASAPPPISTRPAVVEFVGTPGSGKTTLARMLVEYLRAEGLRAGTILDTARDRAARTPPGRAVERLAPPRYRGPLLWQVFYAHGLLDAVAFGADHRALVGHVVRTQRGRPIPRAMRRHTAFWFGQLGGRYRLLAEASDACDVLVMDDGFLHRTVALHASYLEEPDPGDVAAYVDLLPRPDLVVRPVAPREVCERRVHDRGIWRHSRALGPEEIARGLEHAERAVDLAVARALERGWTVIQIETDGRPAEAVARDVRGLVPVLAARLGHVAAGVTG
jgi:broad-specificity NMP kinase